MRGRNPPVSREETLKNVIIYLSVIFCFIILGILIGRYIIPRDPVVIEKVVEKIVYLEKPKIEKVFNYINPIHEEDYIKLSSPYGLREIPKGIYTGGALDRDHEALDLYGTWQARIVAVADGVVKEKWYVPNEYKGYKGHPIYGGYIVILHSDGSETGYGHLSWISSEVHEGDFVSQGQVIARQGDTGLSDGGHLDFSVKINGEYVNPLKYVDIEE